VFDKACGTGDWVTGCVVLVRAMRREIRLNDERGVVLGEAPVVVLFVVCEFVAVAVGSKGLVAA